MWSLLSLLLPVFLPSWQFFKSVGPSPRIEWAVGSADPTWVALTPRPARILARQWITRLLWNPDWNDGLYMVTCAERLLESFDPHCDTEIRTRVQRAANLTATDNMLTFRIVLITRKGAGLAQEVAYLSATFPAR